MRWSWCLKGGILALLYSGVAQALPDTVQVHGYLSQGLVLSSDNNFLGPSESGSLQYGAAALNGIWTPNAWSHVAGQVISYRAGAQADGAPELDYGFADLHSTDTSRVGLRLGRLKTPLGLYNDTRDVPFTHAGILLPQAIYFDRARAQALHVDGAQAYATLAHGEHVLNVTLQAARTARDDPGAEYNFFGRDLPGALEPAVTKGINVNADLYGGRLRLAWSDGDLGLRYAPGAPDFLSAGRVNYQVRIASVQINTEDWTLTGEYAPSVRQYQGFGPFLDDRVPGRAWSLEGVWHVNPRWAGLLRHDRLTVDTRDPEGTRFAAQTNLPASLMFARDWVAGVSWQPDRRWLWKAEVHQVDGNAWLSLEDNPDLSRLQRRWQMFLLQGSWRF